MDGFSDLCVERTQKNVESLSLQIQIGNARFASKVAKMSSFAIIVRANRTNYTSSMPTSFLQSQIKQPRIMIVMAISASFAACGGGGGSSAAPEVANRAPTFGQSS